MPDVDAVDARWNEPDQGIWEVRSAPRHHVNSKVMCWVTVDRAVRVAADVFGRERPEWINLRDAIRDDVLHIDFLRVDLEREIQRKIPVRYFGRAAGVQVGGKLKTFRRHVRISAKPGDIPVELPVDVTPLEAGAYLRLSDMTLDNASFDERIDTPIAFVDPPKAKKEEDEDDKKGKK